MKPGQRKAFEHLFSLIDDVQYRTDHQGNLDCCENDMPLRDNGKKAFRHFGFNLKGSWCPGRESNPYTQRARDFKSLVSTSFTTRAGSRLYRLPDMKKGKRIALSLHVLERQKSLELSTSTLARLRSTN